MKWMITNFLVFSLAIAMISFSGCSTEGDGPLGTGGDPLPVGPSISLVADAGFVTGDVDLGLGETVPLRVSVLPGDADLQSLKITEDGSNIKTDRLTFNNGNIVANNPLLITGNDVSGATYDVTIVPHDVVNTSRIITLEVTDKGNLTASISLAVNITGTPVTEITGILLNQAGPAGQGGLNLNTGEGTGTVSTDPSSLDAHIKDEGIDINKAASENWKRQISGINGSVIRVPGNNMPEGFSYENIITSEALMAAYDVADELTVTNSDGELISDPIEVGDVFLVKNGDDHWLLLVTNVTPTDSDNNDQIEFSIKK